MFTLVDRALYCSLRFGPLANRNQPLSFAIHSNKIMLNYWKHINKSCCSKYCMLQIFSHYFARMNSETQCLIVVDKRPNRNQTAERYRAPFKRTYIHVNICIRNRFKAEFPVSAIYTYFDKPSALFQKSGRGLV